MPALTRTGIFHASKTAQVQFVWESWLLIPIFPSTYKTQPQGRQVGHRRSEMPGTIISFVTHLWDESLVQKIMLAIHTSNLPALSESLCHSNPDFRELKCAAREEFFSGSWGLSTLVRKRHWLPCCLSEGLTSCSGFDKETYWPLFQGCLLQET